MPDTVSCTPPHALQVFASFSAAALLSPRRQYLYLGGYLMAATSTLLVLQLGSLLFGGQLLLYRAHLYAGLLIFSAYVVYDTQVQTWPGKKRAAPWLEGAGGAAGLPAVRVGK